MRMASKGHAVFAATMIALGFLGLIQGDFALVWQDVPRDLPARGALACLCALVSLACGIGFCWRRTAPAAARVLLLSLLVWMLLGKLRFIVLDPFAEVSYQNWGEGAVVVAGAWVLYAWFAAGWDRRWLGFATGERGVRIARVFYALAMVAFGLSHFAYLQLTASLVPGWLPWHVAWAYVTGSAYLAAGMAMLSGTCARLAAVLSALQMGLFTLLVWVPIVVAGHGASQWNEFVVSWTLTASAWVVADSCRDMAWFAVGRR